MLEPNSTVLDTNSLNDSSFSQKEHDASVIASAIEARLAAFESVCSNYPLPTFAGLEGGKSMPTPVEISPHGDERTCTHKLIAQQYKMLGFALIRNSEGAIPAERFPQFAERLGLGEIYVPAYFTLLQGNKGINSSGVAVLSSIGDAEKVVHSSFQSNQSEGLHVDGTVAPIGEVRTSFLFCNSPAAQGGESLLFNAVGACFDLFKRDPALVGALFHPLAMKRGKPESGSTRVGPVFDIFSGELVTRFSVNNTTDWQYGFERVPGLKRAFDAFSEYTRDGSPFMLKFRLSAGVGMVMANDKIAHGRLSFVDSADCVRSMARTLHSGRPGESRRLSGV
jgi:hypothetical protein